MAIAAAAAVLDIYESDEDVCGNLARIGIAMRSAVESAVNASGIEGVTVAGIDPMWMLQFDDSSIERRFLEEAVREGVLFKRGAYNYAALAHDEEETIVDIERAASSALVAVVNEPDE